MKFSKTYLVQKVYKSFKKIIKYQYIHQNQ